MIVVDVDAHGEPASDWLDEFPSLKARLPELFPDTDPRFRLDSCEMFAYFLSDDLFRHVPVEERMPIGRIVTPAMQAIYEPSLAVGLAYPGSEQHHKLVNPAERVAWMDAEGIAAQCIISGVGYTLARAIADPQLGMETLEAVNTWMAAAVAGHRDRLLPVTSLRFEDPDWVVKEMTRMRGLGSRSFLISSEPTAGLPPTHPGFDRVWAAATDLGMVAHLHVGMSPNLIHPGWAKVDNPAIIRLLNVINPHQSAQMLLTAMIFDGVFERHPGLTVLISELGVDWLPRAVATMDNFASPGVSPLVVGDYTLPLAPSDYVKRNVRISPLPAEREPPFELFEALPGVAVFSSDYPHLEGNGRPVAYYRDTLAGLDDQTRRDFMGGTIAECFSRLGDPLKAASPTKGVSL